MTNNIQNTDDLPVILKIISFLVPLVGLVLYLVYRNEAPLKSKSGGKWGLIGFIAGIVLSILMFVAGAVLFTSTIN